MRSMPSAMPPVRRRPHRQRVEQEAELRPLLRRRHLEQVEDPRLELGLVDPERAATELVAVDDHVVRVRERVCRVVRRTDRLPLGDGRVNGWCTAPQRCPLVVPLEHGEVGHPEKAEHGVVDQPELPTETQAQRAEHPRGLAPLVGGEEQRRRRLARQALRARRPTGTSRWASAPLRSPRRRSGTRAPSPPTPSRSPRASRARCARAPAGTRRKRTASARGEDAELRSTRRIGGVLDLERESRVGLVASEAPVGLLVGHARERRRDLDVEALAPDAARTSPPSARRETPRSGKDISTSSCVSSCTRSARRSSSRKQIAIW